MIKLADDLTWVAANAVMVDKDKFKVVANISVGDGAYGILTGWCTAEIKLSLS